MALSFRGEVADFYHRYRRGYPPAAFDVLAEVFGLTPDDLAVDRRCGTARWPCPSRHGCAP